MTISKVKISQLDEIFQIFIDCRAALEKKGIFQWTDKYPTLKIIKNDIQEGNLYCLSENSKTYGVININEFQDPEYNSVHWKDNVDKILVIHRLAVKPEFQNRGFAKKLMDFAEDYAEENNYTSIRLDAYSANPEVLRFYENRDYQRRGEVFFPGRELPFYCYEKFLTEKRSG
ncbi:MAG TPA: GNAT family N-acetyltransferase [Ignavibacteria bacterium]|nr:GNAT family N-acetyltransferase [Ignavibacteria bacterium]HMR41235.1 GNAT family N-acetyltransferase [Ignavibacteria bacterium]